MNAATPHEYHEIDVRLSKVETKLETNIDSINTRLGLMESDLRRLFTMLIGGYVITWGGLIALGLMMFKPSGT